MSSKHDAATSQAQYVTSSNLHAKSEHWLTVARSSSYPRPHFGVERQRIALICIDMQRYFVSPEGRAFLPAAQTVLPNAVRLVRAFRRWGRPVVLTRHGHSSEDDLGILGRFWRDYIRRGEQQWEILPEVVCDGVITLDKNRYDAFHNTQLQAILAAQGVDQVAICGVMTHLCCETTARAAFVRDLEVYFVADATASSSEEFHVAALGNLANGFAIPMATEELVQAISD